MKKFRAPQKFRAQGTGPECPCNSQGLVIPKGLKKGGLNFSCDITPDLEKESSVNKSKEKCT